MLRLITFDVRGTLLKELSSVGDQYCSALSHFLSIKADSSKLNKSFRNVYKAHHRNSPLFGHTENISAKQWWYRVFVATLIESQVFSHNIDGPKITHPFKLEDENPEYITRFDEAFEYVYNNFEWDVTSHSAELLKEINKLKAHQPLCVGIISNNDDRLTNSLQNKGLIEYLDFIVTSFEVGIEKPDSKIFQYAIKQASLLSKEDIKPQEMLHVGDDLDNDYLGARKLGCHALLLDPLQVHSKNKKVQPDHCIQNLSHVMPYISSFLK